MGEEDPEFGGNETYPLNAWAVWVGTSFAAPQITRGDLEDVPRAGPVAAGSRAPDHPARQGDPGLRPGGAAASGYLTRIGPAALRGAERGRRGGVSRR